MAKNSKNVVVILPKNDPNKKSYKNTLASVWARTWKLILGIGAVITIFVAYDPLKKLVQSPQEQYEDEKFSQGDLKLPKLHDSKTSEGIQYSFSDTAPNFTKPQKQARLPEIKGIKIYGVEDRLNVRFGNVNHLIDPKFLKNGFEFLQTSYSDCTDKMLTLVVRDDRLYLSLEFKDLKKKETVGFIEFNHWKLFKENMLDFRNDDERLEVKDRQNNIVLSLKFIPATSDMSFPTLFINGYFLTSSSIIISNTKLNNTMKGDTSTKALCLKTSNLLWQENAEREIEKIKSVF